MTGISRLLSPATMALFAAVLGNAAAAPPPGKETFNDVAKVEVTVEPSTVQRGQTATLKVTLELIPGWHTYPLVQVDPEAKSFENYFRLIDSQEVVPVGDWKDPTGFVAKPEPDLDVKELREYYGKVVWERPLVIRPDAAVGKTRLTLKLHDAPGTKVQGRSAKLQICDEKRCLTLPDVERTAAFTISDAPPVQVEPLYREQVLKSISPPPPSPSGVNDQPKPDKTPGTDSKPSETASPVASAEEHEASLRWVLSQLETQSSVPAGSLAFILAGIFWGAVSLVTPCVFPMIPITVSFFLKQSDKEHHRPVTMALVYCGTIVVVLTVAAVLLLSVFRYLSVNPYMNIGLGLLFIFFALSLFGMYDIELPSGLARFTSEREGRGGLLGTMFMALTFTIVSFACVAPFLGGFGGTSASSQITLLDRVLGGFAFAATFASPFFVLALFPSLLKKLPRSGSWLNNVKVVMGFLELAAALVFFRTSELVLLPRAVLFTYDFTLGLWIAIALLSGLYLLNFFRLPHDTPVEHLGVPRMIFGLLFIGLGLYLLPALFKAGAEGEKQRPNGVVYAWIDSFLLPEPQESRSGELAWGGDLKKAIEEAREQAKRTGKRQLVLIDHTGETCKNCKYNERTVFPRPEVRELMQQFKLVQLYTDKVPDAFYPPAVRAKFAGDVTRQRADAAANLAFQKAAFGTEQLPLYVVLDPLPDGNEKKIKVVKIYSEGKINDPSAFAQYLKDSLGAAGQARAQTGG